MKLMPLSAKENHFGIRHLNLASLSKHIDGFSNLLLNSPIIHLSEHKSD